MNEDWISIPEAFVNRTNFIRLAKEAYEYRRWRNIATVFAVSGWAVVVFMLIIK